MTETQHSKRVTLATDLLNRLEKYRQGWWDEGQTISHLIDYTEELEKQLKELKAKSPSSQKTKKVKTDTTPKVTPKSQKARKTKKTKDPKYDYDEDVQRV